MRFEWFRKRKPETSHFQRLVREAQRQRESSDLSRRQQLIDEANRQQLETQDLPVVSLEDFFTGNEDVGSIGCNLSPVLGPRTFHETLRAIRARPDVQDVLIEIPDTSENDPDPFTWPFSDQVYILAGAPREEVERWLAPLQPDEVEATCINPRVLTVELKNGMKIYRAWWD